MSNFSKLIWKQCEILHNTAHEYNNKCIIGVPVFKDNLSETEKASLNQLCKIIGDSYEICLICPKNIQLNDYVNIAYSNNVYLSFLFCSNDYFKSIETYSYLCETPEFYKCFKEYQYLFIYQLDGWIFSNLLYYYINLNVDYIGGIWDDGHKETIGNGGVSLRRVQKFIDICKSLTEDDYNKEYVKQEDIFFCHTLKNKANLKFPSLKNASNFVLTNRYQHFIQKYNNNHLPMCLHAWNKNYDILSNYIKIEYNESKHISNNKITFKNLNTFNEILKLNIVKSQKENKEIKKKYFNNQHNIQMPTKYNWNTFIEKYYNIPQKKTIKETQELIMPKKQIIPKNTHIVKSDKIIVSFTSWPKRINKCVHTIELMLTQTLMPDKIILNLSYDEFKNKENDLPIDLLQIIKNNELCEIYWVKENTKPYKKLIPTLKRFPNDVIITIDDDIEYPINFIEEMYKEYLAYDKQCPITGSKYEWQNGIYNHFGCYSLVKGDFFGKYIFDLYENLYVKNPNDFPLSDPLFTYAILLNGRRYKATENLNMDIYRKKAGQDIYSLSKFSNKQYIESRNKEHKLIKDYIKNTYNKTYEQLFEAPIYVNITTWNQRDMYLPIMLKNLLHQTKKPNKIILWLSKEEYNEVPSHIQQCLIDNLLTEIRWTNRNIYCHKRHEIFKTDNNVYNMFMDDDLLYEQTYIENLYNSSIQHPNAISAMAGSRRDFNGIKQTSNLIQNNCDNKNAFFGGLTCYPPYIFPLESFNYIPIRDKYSQKCDETWVWCWCIKKGIKINILKQGINYKLNAIDDSSKSALWNENKILNNDNLMFKEEMLHNVIYHLNIQNKINELFPKYKMYKNVIKSVKPEILFDKYGNLLNIDKIKQYKLKNYYSSQMNDIDNPKTLQEKLHWLMLYDNNKIKAECADKIKVHDYCIKKIGKDICVPIIKIYDNINDINLNELPDKFVLKCNHGCRMNIIVKNKSNIDKNYKELLSTWMNKDFGQVLLEPHYSLIEPKIFIENLLEDDKNKYLIDYKFWCFNGNPKFYTINSDNGHQGGTNIIYYDIETDEDMKVYNKSGNYIYFDKPKNFKLMIEYAKKLSEDFKFVRVDFYEINNQVYLGELSFTPGAGCMMYKNIGIAIKLGNLLKL